MGRALFRPSERGDRALGGDITGESKACDDLGGEFCFSPAKGETFPSSTNREKSRVTILFLHSELGK